MQIYKVIEKKINQSLRASNHNRVFFILHLCTLHYLCHLISTKKVKSHHLRENFLGIINKNNKKKANALKKK